MTERAYGFALGFGLALPALTLLAVLSLALGAVYFRVTGAEATRRQRVREAVEAERQARQRPPMLSDGEVPEDPGDLLRSKRRWWRRVLRR